GLVFIVLHVPIAFFGIPHAERQGGLGTLGCCFQLVSAECARRFDMEQPVRRAGDFILSGPAFGLELGCSDGIFIRMGKCTTCFFTASVVACFALFRLPSFVIECPPAIVWWKSAPESQESQRSDGDHNRYNITDTTFGHE